MIRMTGPDHAVICNLINTHKDDTIVDLELAGQVRVLQHKMSWATGSGCVVKCNLVNTHTHTKYWA